MESLFVVLLKFLPILLLLLLGALIRKIRLLSAETVQGLKTLIVNLSLPSMLLLTFARTDFSLRYLAIFAAVFLVCLVLLPVGRLFSKRLCPGNRYYPAVFTGFESGMLGYALFSAFFGAENTYRFAIFDLAQVSFVFIVLVSFLRRQNGAGASSKELLLGLVKSPVILAISAGIALSTTGLTGVLQPFRPASAFVSALETLSGLTVPLICITLGYELRIRPGKLLRPLLTVLVRMVLMLGFAFLINETLVVRALGLEKGFSLALFTMFLLPPPFVIPIFIDPSAEEEKDAILNVLSVHIVLSLAAFLVLVSVML